MLIDDILAAVDIPLLPPPRAVLRRRRSAEIAVRLLSLGCAATSLFTFTLYGIGECRTIREEGAWNYCKTQLLGNDQFAPGFLGNDIATLAFGAEPATAATTADAFPEVPIDLTPAYVAEAEIEEAIRKQEAETEAARAALYNREITPPEGFYPILPIDVSAKSETEIKNETGFTLHMEAILEAAKNRAPEEFSDDPIVLVIHTHGTESFSAEGVDYYNESFNRPRTDDTAANTVAVGNALCEALNARGIGTVHCEIMHDAESYIEAYTRSAETVRTYLAAYPSIRYVFDVHRDSLIRSDLTKFRPVTLKSGEPCAQIMMLVGSGEKGAGDYDWEGNLVLAEAIQCELFADSPGVARPLCLRGASYNQQYAKYSLLLEIGSCGNTLAEAKLAATAFADAFADVLLKEP